MIGRLQGILAEQSADGSVLVDVGGVAYEVHIPIGTLGRATEGSEVTLWIHTHVREDAFQLFGFDSPEAKSAFRALLTVSNVGPRLALAILGQLNPFDLAVALEREDRDAFKGISGVGKKTVERILLDLHGKFILPSRGGMAVPNIIRPQVAAPQGPAEEVVLLLCNMGYKRPEAERAVAALKDVESKPLATLLREALAGL